MKMVIEFNVGGMKMASRGNYQTKQKEVIAEYFQAHPDACVTAEEVYAALGTDVGMWAISGSCAVWYTRRSAC